MNVYNLELVWNNEIRNYATDKRDLLTVYCLHDILFDIFFHNADVCIFERTISIVLLYIHTRQIHRFHRVHEICDQSDLVILSQNYKLGIWYIFEVLLIMSQKSDMLCTKRMCQLSSKIPVFVESDFRLQFFHSLWSWDLFTWTPETKTWEHQRLRYAGYTKIICMCVLKKH